MTSFSITTRDRSHVERYALVGGAAGLAGGLVLTFASPATFLPAYLVAFFYFAGIAAGCISLLLLHNLVGGGWGWAIRRPLEAGALTIVPLAVLFLPIIIWAGGAYPWINPEPEMAKAIASKAGYLSRWAFAGRALLYFLLWSALAYGLNRQGIARAGQEARLADHWMSSFSGPGLVAMFVTMTLAAIDWGMSREPEWSSSIYGAMVIIGWGLTTFAVMIIAARSVEPAERLTTVRLHDVGNLMLAFTMLWAYMSFSQLLIIWSGNLREEIPWYLRRSIGGWWTVALMLVIFHFVAPFLVLLFRDTKRNVKPLLRVAVALAIVHVIDICWLIIPSGNPNVMVPDYRLWLTVLAVPITLLGIGGVVLWSFLWFLDNPDFMVALRAGAAPSAQTMGGQR